MHLIFVYDEFLRGHDRPRSCSLRLNRSHRISNTNTRPQQVCGNAILCREAVILGNTWPIDKLTDKTSGLKNA